MRKSSNEFSSGEYACWIQCFAKNISFKNYQNLFQILKNKCTASAVIIILL